MAGHFIFLRCQYEDFHGSYGSHGWMKLIDERLMAQKRNVFEYVLCTCAAAVCLYFLFAITAPSFSSLIDQQISNFWHYETGHRVFESSGGFN